MRAVRLHGPSGFFFQHGDKRHAARQHLIEIEPVHADQVRLPPAAERFEAIGSKARVAYEKPARPSSFAGDFTRECQQIGDTNLRAVPLRFEKIHFRVKPKAPIDLFPHETERASRREPVYPEQLAQEGFEGQAGA